MAKNGVPPEVPERVRPAPFLLGPGVEAGTHKEAAETLRVDPMLLKFVVECVRRDVRRGRNGRQITYDNLTLETLNAYFNRVDPHHKFRRGLGVKTRGRVYGTSNKERAEP